jgi:hypothetical protein
MRVCIKKKEITMPTKEYRNGVFISYSHKDKLWLEKLQTILMPLVRNETIALWDDTKIPVGATWANEIENAIASSRVAVLLVTPNFLASKFIASKELPRILSAHRQRGLVVFWISVSAALYNVTELAKFQAANDPSRPLDSLPASEQNQVLVQLAEKIARAVDVNAIANVFSIVDDFAPQVKAFVEGKKEPTTQVKHKVVAHQQDDTIRFETEGGPTDVITADDLKKLDLASQQLIRSYEFAMKDLFNRWTELQPKRVARDPEVKKQARSESEEVRKDLCEQLNQILNFVDFMGKSLEDHYYHVRFLCSQSPMLE